MLSQVISIPGLTKMPIKLPFRFPGLSRYAIRERADLRGQSTPIEIRETGRRPDGPAEVSP